MSLGAETNTRWLWFLTYILLPFNVVAQILGLFYYLDADQGGVGILFILAELCLAIATIVGLHQQKPWGLYFIMVVFGLQLIGTPLKVHAKTSMRYDTIRDANSYRQSQGLEPHRIVKPSLFDFEPMFAFFLLLAIWTIPNLVYIYRRRQLFGITENFDTAWMYPSTSYEGGIRMTSTHRNIVTDEEEALYVQVAKEFDSGNIREGLWTKVTVEETDTTKQRAAYIRYRVAQLHHEVSVVQPRQMRNNRRNIQFQTVKKWYRSKISPSFEHDRTMGILLAIICALIALKSC